MAIFKRIVDFLPKGTQLFVSVNPSGDIPLHAKRHLSTKIKTQTIDHGMYVPLRLEELLQIEFAVSRSGRIIKNLCSCICTTPVLPDETFKSLNHAYQKISGLLEPHRRSQGGRVYGKVYFNDSSEYWEPLDVLRNRIYQPLEDEFEEHRRVIQERVPGYIRPIPETEQVFSHEIRQRDQFIGALLSEQQHLQAHINQIRELLEASKLTAYRQKIDEFRQRLENDYPEVHGMESWQKWIYKNNWLFGIQYGNPIGHPRVGFRSILDYLFPTPDGFVDILEIKKPTQPVIKEDRSHPGAFRWSSEVNEAIGQVVNYLYEIELHQLEISKRLKQELRIELSAIKPRAFILIGKSDTWSESEKEAFRRLNHSLHEIEVLTYTDLLHRAENLIKVYGD